MDVLGGMKLKKMAIPGPLEYYHLVKLIVSLALARYVSKQMISRKKCKLCNSCLFTIFCRRDTQLAIENNASLSAVNIKCMTNHPVVQGAQLTELR